MGMDPIMVSMMLQSAASNAAENRRNQDFQERLFNQAAEKAARADQAIADQAAARKKTGIAGQTSFVNNLKSRITAGLITEGEAQQSLEDYYGKYEIGDDTGTERKGITDAYSEFIPGRRKLELESLYARNLKRNIKEDELTTGLAKLGKGLTLESLEDDLRATSEYTDARPGSAFEAEMESRYGGPVLDAAGKRTKQYKLDFSKLGSPALSSDLSSKTGITRPDFLGSAFTGSAEEIEAAKGKASTYDSFLYNSGIKSLEGNIAKEQLKLQTEGESRLGRERGQANLLQGLVGAFNFS